MTEIEIKQLSRVTGGRSNYNEPSELQWENQQAKRKQFQWPGNIPRDGA